MDPLQILKAYSCVTCLSGRYQPTPYVSQTGETMTTASVSLSAASNPTTPKPGCRNSTLQSRPMYFNVPKTLCIKVGTVVYRRYYVMDVKPKTQTISSASTTSEDHPREVSKRSLKSPSIRVLPPKYRSWIGQEKLE